MTILEIKKLENGGHDNMTSDYITEIPEGWAKIPDNVELKNFPFGDVTAEEIDGVMTVTAWIPGEIPEHEDVTPEPTAQDDINAMLVDHEYRLTLIELGVN